MKVIDLLNKIANGEEVPKKIKYNDTTYTYHERVEKIYGFVDEQGTYLEEQYYITGVLNHEVEIIEEDKEIEELDAISYYDETKTLYQIDYEKAQDKINELVKAVNELKKGK